MVQQTVSDSEMTEEIDIASFLDGIQAPEDQSPPKARRQTSCPDDEVGLPPEELKNRIACYYVNEQLEEALLRYGRIPGDTEVATLGVGFLDIVDYSYLSSWLSPKENRLFLNGLYTAFNGTLRKRGGYLNKISGDSMMFHFGGPIDPDAMAVAEGARETHIARKLFQTCVELLETCREFNQADEGFLDRATDEESREALEQAFVIVRNLRENLAMVSSINAMFQVKVRVGASVGEVCVGNFGPEGLRQWDIIGNTVIEARRMESTAPHDGLRITSRLYDALQASKAVDEYFKAFRAKARGYYRQIAKDELFSNRVVVLQDKKDASFDSWAVQADPNLPEEVREQAKALLDREDGADSVVGLVKAYRGNRLVLEALESLFAEHGIRLHKLEILRKLLPTRYREAEAKLNKGAGSLESRASLFLLFSMLSRYQDALHGPDEVVEELAFSGYEAYMKSVDRDLRGAMDAQRKQRSQRLYFENYLYPYVFASIKASILEAQARARAEATRTA
jgi:adenylate cyclase